MMKRTSFSITVFAAGVLAPGLILSSCAPTAVTASRGENDALAGQIASIAEAAMKEHGVPGLAVGVVRQGKVVYARGFGVSAIGEEQPVTTRSIFHMASVTKTFTATAVMQLVERGRIRLDSPVVEYLPYFRTQGDDYRRITIRHLLHHRSGVPFVEENPFELKPVFDEGALERHVRALSNRKLSFVPGERYEYSNYGYDILGDVVAKVSAMPFEEYVRRNVLAPLKMDDSTMLVRDVPSQTLLSAYFSDPEGKISPIPVFPYTRPFTPSSNLYTNVEDMNRWLMAHLRRGSLDGGRILNAASYATFWGTPLPPSQESAFPNGGDMVGGWFRWNYRGRRLVGHGGADLGFNSFIVLAPEEDIGIVVLGNLYPAKVNYLPTGAYYTGTVARQILDRLLEETAPTPR